MDIQTNYSLSEYGYSNKLQITRIWIFKQTTVNQNIDIYTYINKYRPKKYRIHAERGWLRITIKNRNMKLY